MNPITFIYFSQSGSTLQIVEAAAKGVVEVSGVMLAQPSASVVISRTSCGTEAVYPDKQVVSQ